MPKTLNKYYVCFSKRGSRGGRSGGMRAQGTTLARMVKNPGMQPRFRLSVAAYSIKAGNNLV